MISAATWREVRDLERTLGRLSAGSGNGRDLLALRGALEKIPALKEILGALRSARAAPELARLPTSDRRPAPGLDRGTGRSIGGSAGFGGIDRPRHCGRAAAGGEGGRADPRRVRRGRWMSCAARRARERTGSPSSSSDEIARTGIASLKVRFNSVFGYFIEITKANLDKAPAHYIRKQTIGQRRTVHHAGIEGDGGENPRSGGAEREAGVRIVPARARAGAGAVAALAANGGRAGAIGRAGGASPRRRACTIIAARKLARRGSCDIREGRHPVLEQTLAGERFVPNDVSLDPRRSQLMLITGPNMAGKSTFIRQVALHHAAGPHRLVCAGGGGADRPGRPHFHAHRRQRRPGARAIHVHGGDERDGEHPEQRHRRAA